MPLSFHVECDACGRTDVTRWHWFADGTPSIDAADLDDERRPHFWTRERAPKIARGLQDDEWIIYCPSCGDTIRAARDAAIAELKSKRET